MLDLTKVVQFIVFKETKSACRQMSGYVAFNCVGEVVVRSPLVDVKEFSALHRECRQKFKKAVSLNENIAVVKGEKWEEP